MARVYGFGANAFGNCVPPEVSKDLNVLLPILIPDATAVLAASFSQTVLSTQSNARQLLGANGDLPDAGALLGADDFAAVLVDGQLRRLDELNGSETLHGCRLACMNGRGEVLVLKDDSRLHLFESISSALGIETKNVSHTYPTNPRDPILQLAGGASHFLLRTATSVFSLGDNRFNQCGVPQTPRLPPGEPPPLHHVDFFDGLEPTLVAAGDLHSIVLTKDGSAYTFGSDREGQCGGGGGEPTLITLGDAEVEDQPVVVDAACGSGHSVLATSGGVWVAGSNHSGQLGLGDTESRKGFVEVSSLAGEPCVGAMCSRWTTFVWITPQNTGDK